MTTLDGIPQSNCVYIFFNSEHCWHCLPLTIAVQALIAKVICLHCKFTVMKNEDYCEHKVYCGKLFPRHVTKKNITALHRMDHMVFRKDVDVLKKVSIML